MVPGRINFFYFGFLFCAIALVHAFHVLLIETSFWQQVLFVVDALLQSLWEVILLLLLGELIMRWAPKVFYLFVGLTFLILVAHLIDFFLVRLMDLTIWYGFLLVREETIGNFVQMLRATSIPLMMWALFAAAVLILPFLGIFLFRFMQKWNHKRPTSFRKPLIALGSASVLLFLWDVCRILPEDFQLYDKFRKTLPFKMTFTAPSPQKISIPPSRNAECENEDLLLKTVAPLVVYKPDVYIFIVESLREDFVTEEVSPTFLKFKKENIVSPLSISSANATHLSWFSLFTSKFPIFWSQSELECKKSGAFPLRLFKEMGYSINVYTSARLNFYEMDKRFFGTKSPFADQVFLYSHEDGTPVHVSDERTISKLIEEMQKGSSEGGRLHVVFLDSTHFDYSWPKETGTLFLPVHEEIDYFKAAYSQEELEGIKNRYRNAIHYVDSLFARFLQTLNKTERGKEAIVVLTGDHGEEFYEEGHLFHASSLNAPQTHIPIYYKIGSKRDHLNMVQAKVTSHVDIFPTLFHYMFQKEIPLSPMHGESIFKEERWPYAISARYNAGRNPTEFIVHTGYKKITFRTEEGSRELSILSLKDLCDKNLPLQIAEVHDEFDPALERLFSR